MEDRKTCHQCRQRTNNFVASCNNLKKGKLCPLKYCSRCLLNRYLENAEEVERQNDWTCPKCKEICNCSCCRKRKGLRPIGKGFSSTSQIPEVRDPEIPDARDSKTLDMQIDVIVEKVIDVKEGEAEAILQELVRKQNLRQGENVLAIQFQIRLLTLVLQDLGNRSPSLSITDGKDSWFKALMDIISRSDLVVKELQLGCLKEGIDKYYDLDLSEKLSLLNFLCDEALGTKKLRSFIDDENLKYVEKRKQVKAKVAEATKKEQSLKRNLKDVMAKTTTSENGATLSTSEHDALLSEIRGEVAKAHAERVEAINTQLSFGNQRSDALRVEPVFSNGSGQTLWRLNCYTTEYAFLMQDIKVEDALDERWFVYCGENKEEMEKYIASSRSKRRKIWNDSRTFNTDSCEEHM